MIAVYFLLASEGADELDAMLATLHGQSHNWRESQDGKGVELPGYGHVLVIGSKGALVLLLPPCLMTAGFGTENQPGGLDRPDV